MIGMRGGDGPTMLMGDLLTLRQEQLPVKRLIYDNGSLDLVEMEQRGAGRLDAFSELQDQYFAKLANACGMPGWRMEQGDQMESAMHGWLAVDGAARRRLPQSRSESLRSG